VTAYAYQFFNGHQEQENGIRLHFTAVPYMPTRWEDVEVQVSIINPVNGTLETVFLGYLEGPEFFLSSEEPPLNGLLKAWVDLCGKDVGTSLIVDIWAFLENGTVLEVRPSLFVFFRPYDALSGLVVREVTVNTSKALRVSANQGCRCSYPRSPMNGPGSYCGYEWWNVDDYCYCSDYMEVPIFMVVNPSSYAGVIDWWFKIKSEHETWFYVTEAYGTDILDYVPEVELKIYNGKDLGVSYSTTAVFQVDHYTDPGYSHWVYLVARVAHLHQRKYFVCRQLGTDEILYYEDTGEERILEYVFDVKRRRLPTGIYEFVGDYKEGLPPEEIMEWFYNGTEKEYVKTLDVGEKLYSEEVIEGYDVYEEDFEIGIPLGAIVAALAGVPEAYAMAVAPLVISLSWGESASVRLDFGLENDGQESGVGYDVSMRIYVMVSRYKFLYKETDEPYKVPAGIYFECRSSSGGTPPPPGGDHPYPYGG